VKWRRTARLGALPQRMVAIARFTHQHFLQHCFQLRANANSLQTKFPYSCHTVLVAPARQQHQCCYSQAYKSLLGKTLPLATVPLGRSLLPNRVCISLLVNFETTVTSTCLTPPKSLSTQERLSRRLSGRYLDGLLLSGCRIILVVFGTVVLLLLPHQAPRDFNNWQV